MKISAGTYELRFDRDAAEVCEEADDRLARRLNRCFERLRESPFYHPDIKALKGDLAGLYRYQVGKWRVICEPDEDKHAVYIFYRLSSGIKPIVKARRALRQCRQDELNCLILNELYLMN